MTRLYKTKTFKELQAIWDKNLKDSGFKDVEKTRNGERVLCADPAATETPDSIRETKSEYYRVICYHANRTHFRSSIDKHIMFMLSDGSKIKTIVSQLAKDGISIHRQTVRYIIRRYEHEWGIRYWELRQRYLKR